MTEDRKSDLAVQNSYAGHVRIGDLDLDGAPDTIVETLAPLMAPRPSAGQFYLDSTALKGAQRIAPRNSRPTSHWGSSADDPEHPRSIRGRKFYWRTSSGQLSGRGQVRREPEPKINKRVTMLRPESKFGGRIYFDNVTLADLGSLLACLDPARRWPDAATDSFALSLGGGKPFGLGAVRVAIGDVVVQSAASRYLGRPAHQAQTVDEAVQRFRGEADSAEVDEVALRNVLTLNYVDDDLVWYPIFQGHQGSEDYDKAFEWFAGSRGVAMRDHSVPLVELPAASGSGASQILDAPPHA